MKKVCCFCETWSSGGIESFLSGLLSRMDQTDLQIDLVVAKQDDSVFSDTLEKSGISLVELSGSKFRWLSNCIRFRKLLNEKRYDVVHLNVFQGLQLLYAFLAKRCGVPVRIVHSHGSDLRKSTLRTGKLLLHQIGKLLFGKSATDFWACSSAAGQFMFPKGTSFRVISNGIDTERYRFRSDGRERIRKEVALDGKFVIGNVGRLQYDKNQAFLLDVLKELLSEQPESVLLLVGEGKARQELLDKAEKLGIADRVIFYGLSDRVEELLWGMDAFAFPSLSEGLGLAAVEAQAAGLPVICSEFIPEEVNLTPKLQRLPLTSGAAAWAQVLLRADRGGREECAGAVRRAGFELSDVAEVVQAGYLNGLE